MPRIKGSKNRTKIDLVHFGVRPPYDFLTER